MNFGERSNNDDDRNHPEEVLRALMREIALGPPAENDHSPIGPTNDPYANLGANALRLYPWGSNRTLPPLN